MSFNWTCPHCGRHTTINDDRVSVEGHKFDHGSKYGQQVLYSVVIACPNPECRELTIKASLGGYKPKGPYGDYVLENTRERWNLVPQASVKVFPDYVPAPILADYKEACLIADLSPKASATLARRCLQGMIRDFWGVRKARLIDEIEGIKDRVDATAWKAIDAVRSIGNIGAHMERDINTIVDVEPGEAALLIDLIETLIADWYIERHEREQRMTAVVLAASKKARPSPRKEE
jgi:uncharacterized protein DUF4145